MIEKIEAKIESYIGTILEKDSIDFNDYQALYNECLRLYMLREKESVDAERKASAERMQHALESMGQYCNAIK